MIDTGLDKSLARFLPLQSLSRAECERHYTKVHIPFARAMLRDQPAVISYHTDRVVAEYDLAGGWRQRPRAWRFVLLHLQPGQHRTTSADLQEAIAQDHRNCLRELRSCAVRERVALDRRNGQLVLCKYLFEYDRRVDTDLQTDRERFHAVVDGALDLLDQAAGLRLVLVDDVISEGATEPIDEPGQRRLDHYLPSTDKLGYLEFYFDNIYGAETWFARPEVRAMLCDQYFAVARGYRIEEHCGIDKR